MTYFRNVAEDVSDKLTCPRERCAKAITVTIHMNFRSNPLPIDGDLGMCIHCACTYIFTDNATKIAIPPDSAVDDIDKEYPGYKDKVRRCILLVMQLNGKI